MGQFYESEFPGRVAAERCSSSGPPHEGQHIDPRIAARGFLPGESQKCRFFERNLHPKKLIRKDTFFAHAERFLRTILTSFLDPRGGPITAIFLPHFLAAISAKGVGRHQDINRRYLEKYLSSKKSPEEGSAKKHWRSFSSWLVRMG